MSDKELLFQFESKYPFLYEITVGYVPVYTCIREHVLVRLKNPDSVKFQNGQNKKGKIYFTRILDGFLKFRSFRNKKTLVFTSAVYRRDKGRNLAAEWLMKEYPEVGVFEWPCRDESYDGTYMKDSERQFYCPMDWVLLVSKAYARVRRRKIRQYEQICRTTLLHLFDSSELPEESERIAIEYILKVLPESYAQTKSYHDLFGIMFKNYKKVEHAIDFWGGARENIIPILPTRPCSIELQHGIIMNFHTGYTYPKFVRDLHNPFFERKILVYGEGTKTNLCQNSIFEAEQVQVVGNPRIALYKTIDTKNSNDKKLLLFTSESFESDGRGTKYYVSIIKYLQKVLQMICDDKFWNKYCLGIKLHPRESHEARAFYERELPGVLVFDGSAQLYDLMKQSFLQITVSSTTLYEAAEFGTPTITLLYNDFSVKEVYGFDVWQAVGEHELEELMSKLTNSKIYDEYLEYLSCETKKYM